MTPERWRQVKQIFQAALERAPEEVSAFLASACGEDQALRREVESLIASHEKDGSFIDTPAYKAAAQFIVDEKGELKAGQAVGSYEILSFIGLGGMGDVYLAHDRRLGRKVALKFLPASFTRDVDRLRRFDQEARTASALNHPNIITIYEIASINSMHVIATEFVEGETLRERIAHDALTVQEALHVAVQIADALTAAHKAGIVHRDIKPENIMLRPDGYVKVLDFGLAKLAEASPELAADALTRQVRTASGMIVGTVGYMSPEQARGKEVDARSDIFSLGAVIYEMVTRRKPFEGETPSDTLAAILKSEPPPIAQFLPDPPSELVRIINKSLKKDPEERYQFVKELLIDLRALKQKVDFHAKLGQPAPTGIPSLAAPAAAGTLPETSNLSNSSPTISGSLSRETRRHRVRVALGLSLATVVVIALGFWVWRTLNQRESSPRNSPPSVANIVRITAWPSLDTQPTLSPDGNSVAYSSDHSGSFEIYVKQLTTGGREILLTPNEPEVFQPAWSPDGQRIAYYSKKRGGIWVVPALGGEARQLAEFGSAPAWSHDGAMIAFQSDANPDLGSGSIGSSTIWIVPAQAGTPKQLTKVGAPIGGHVRPTWSADNQRIAFVDLNYTTQQIWSVSVNSGEVKQLTHRPSARVNNPANWTDPLNGRAGYPVYSPDGHNLYFAVGPVIWMLPISPDNDEPLGDPVRVSDAGASVINSITLSADGKRMAYSLQALTSNIWSLPVSSTASTSAGSPKQLTNQTGARNSQPTLSADGRKLAFVQFLQGGRVSLWVADADGSNPTPTSANGNIPTWFPDGDQLAFTSNRENHWSIWATSVQKGRERLLFDAGRDIQYARLSPDGKQLAFNLSDDKGVINLWTVPVAGGPPKQLTSDQELAGFAAWSPDGKFIAYQLKRGDDAYVMVEPSDGGEPVQLVFDHGRSWPYSFSPDGDKVAFAGERNEVWNIYWVSRSTKQQKQLTSYTKPNAYVRYPAWSPLGNQIAYEYAETTGNIWLIELK